MLRHILFSIVVFCLISAAAHAQEGPELEEMQERFMIELPTAWTLQAFDIEAAANYGTAVEPVIRSRFSAVVELGEGTFMMVRQDGPFTFVRSVAQAGETRTLHGIAQSVRRAGAWHTEFMLEANPMEGIGEPRDLIPGRMIILGSEEEVEFRSQLKRRRLPSI
jgi:hypothetical protein